MPPCDMGGGVILHGDHIPHGFIGEGAGDIAGNAGDIPGKVVGY